MFKIIFQIHHDSLKNSFYIQKRKNEFKFFLGEGRTILTSWLVVQLDEKWERGGGERKWLRKMMIEE